MHLRLPSKDGVCRIGLTMVKPKDAGDRSTKVSALLQRPGILLKGVMDDIAGVWDLQTARDLHKHPEAPQFL